MKKKLALVLPVLVLALCLGLWPAHPAAAEEAYTPEDFSYTLDPETGTILLSKYIGSAQQVTVHGCYTAEGASWRTVLASGTVFRGNTNLTSVTLEAGVGFRNDSMRLLFGECTKLTQADLSAVDTSRVTDMSYVFYQCSALRSLDLSALDTGKVTTIRGMFSGCTRLTDLRGYEHWDTGALQVMYQTFNAVANSNAGTLACIDLSAWDLDQVLNTGWCFQNCKAQQILLPDDLAVMSAGFLNHASKVAGSSFTIPAGVKKIGYAHTIYDFATNDFTEFRVAEGNTAYKAVDGVLFSADGRELLAVPRNKPFPDGVYEIPEGVGFLGELSFSRNYNLHTLVLPDSYEIEYVPLYDPRYIVYEDTGNLNAGTNLSIAIYCYTGVNAYAVKDTNPRYASRDGVVYTKDMRGLVAVPARYDRSLEIPEGVTHWDREAMWADGSATVDNLLAGCGGVTIPASMAEIAEDQLAMLNRLRRNRAGTDNPFTVTLAEGCETFLFNGDGDLIPREAVTILQQPRDWSGLLGEYPAITVSALGEDLRYQWYFRNAGMETWSRSSETDDTYDAYPLTPERAGREVFCVISDSLGNTAATEPAVMSFAVPDGHTGPRITLQPADWAGEYGETPELRVAAEGDGLTYQWYFRNAGEETWLRSSETDAAYDGYPLTAARDGREVYCAVTDKYGFTAVSDTAVMRRYIPQGYTGPVITVQPADWQGLYGETPELRVAAEGEGITCQWYFRNAGTETWLRSSEQDDCYDAYPLTPERAGRQVYCVVTDQYGFTAVSNTAVMDFLRPEGHTGPVVTRQPESWAGALGEYPAIRVEAEGEGLRYQWYYRNAGEETWLRSSEQDECYDAYPLTPFRAGRQVYCVITDQYGFAVQSAAAELRLG